MAVHLGEAGLTWALRQALNYGDTDIFPKAFEFKAVEENWDALIAPWLMKENVGKWTVRPLRRTLTPKHRYGFRISTQLDPVDYLVFTALVYEMGADIESRRIPVTDGVVYSYRFAPEADGAMFSRDYGYGLFIKLCDGLTEGDALGGGGKHDWVVVADIADFFPRLYTHRVKNALEHLTAKPDHAAAISGLIGQWNGAYSYGIPIGSAASRLIAELAIDDVDRALLSEGTTFVRYSDDYRLFCNSHREAHEKLAYLANVLWENHGLTLAQNKTRILHREAFRKGYISTEEDKEVSQVYAFFDGLGLTWEDTYTELEWEDLSDEKKAEMASLNLEDWLQKEVQNEEIDIQLTRFLLRRLRQLGDNSCVDTVLESVDNLYPVLPQVVQYLESAQDLTAEQLTSIGERVLGLLDGSVVSHLEFHRMWLLSLFANGTVWDNSDGLSPLFASATDTFTQRKLILALGRAKQDQWFRTRKRSMSDFSPWTRRSLLAGGSCLPTDERKHWYRSLERQLDPLELAVTKWAQQHPF